MVDVRNYLGDKSNEMHEHPDRFRRQKSERPGQLISQVVRTRTGQQACMHALVAMRW